MKIWSASLAWVASVFGWSEAAARAGIIVVLALAALAALWWWWRRREADTSLGPAMAFAGAGAGAGAATAPRQYSPMNVGNDASARPWENSALPELSDLPPEAVSPPQPDDFDRGAFLEASKANFVLLQQAWDRADIPALRAMMTADMASLIQGQLAAREQAADVAVKQSEVVMLEAKLLGIEDLAAAWMASVEFSGLLREEPSSGPNPFREVWSITRPKGADAAWLVAGVQALQ